MTQQLLIPNKIKVGFQNRSDTYTKKLAYVIYYDKSGKLRKEASWNSWRDKKIDPEEYENVPTEGFVLNKKVGGYRSEWNHRSTYVRVFDPRGFEFEISVPNLLFILVEGDCSRGKGLEGKFVYSWDGKDLVLLPVSSLDYKNSQEFSELQGQKVKAKELIPGATYLTKKQTKLLFLGKLSCSFNRYDYTHGYRHCKPGKHFVFWNNNRSNNTAGFEFHASVKDLARLESAEVSPDYADLMDKFNKSRYGSKIVKLFTKPFDGTEKHGCWAFEQSPGEFLVCSNIKTPNGGWGYYGNRYGNWGQLKDGDAINVHSSITFKQNSIVVTNIERVAFRTKDIPRPNHYWTDRKVEYDWIEPTKLKLCAELDSGKIYEVDNYGHLLRAGDE